MILAQDVVRISKLKSSLSEMYDNVNTSSLFESLSSVLACFMELDSFHCKSTRNVVTTLWKENMLQYFHLNKIQARKPPYSQVL